MSLTDLISEYLTYLPSITGHKAVFRRCLGQERTNLIACIRFYRTGKSFLLKGSVYFAFLYCQMSDGPSIIIYAELKYMYFNSHTVFPIISLLSLGFTPLLPRATECFPNGLWAIKLSYLSPLNSVHI